MCVKALTDMQTLYAALHAGKPAHGIYLLPPIGKQMLIQKLKVFTLHTVAPYVRSCRHSLCRGVAKAGTGWGWRDYLGNVNQAYPDKYTGPYTIGVLWQKASTGAGPTKANSKALHVI